MISTLYLIGPVSDSGYGVITEATALHLLKRGVAVVLTATGLPANPSLVPPFLSRIFRPPEFIETAIAQNIPILVHVNPDRFDGHGCLVLKTDNGVTVPIHVVPEGLDPTDNPEHHRPPANVFRFFCLEKCVSITVAAFRKAFGEDPGVQ